MTKAQLRQIYRNKRAELPLADADRLSRQIANRFLSEFDVRQLKVLSVFIRIARHNEVDTSIIYYRLWRDCPRLKTVAPSIDLVTGAIESVEFSPASDLVEGPWGLREPLGKCIDPQEIDMVLVPLLCFDNAGHRVGYGKGFYDRLLAACREDCKKVGVSYFGPVAAIEDVSSSDVRLNACITPLETFHFGQD